MRRLLWATLAGWAVGILVGLGWFLVILFMPSDFGDHDGDGSGGGLYIILSVFAAGFVMVGALVGCLIGFLLGGIYNLAEGMVFRVARMKLGRGVPP
jgi:hypothetical protein